jgi:hypothetical protein
MLSPPNRLRPQEKALFAIDPPNAFMVHEQPLPAQKRVDAKVAVARTSSGQVLDPEPEVAIVARALGFVEVGRALKTKQPAKLPDRGGVLLAKIPRQLTALGRP